MYCVHKRQKKSSALGVSRICTNRSRMYLLPLVLMLFSPLFWVPSHAFSRRTIPEATCSLIFVDWPISGRERSFLSTDQALSNREEQYEQRAFESYDTKTVIYVDDKPLLVDRARLAGHIILSLSRSNPTDSSITDDKMISPRLKWQERTLSEFSLCSVPDFHV